MVHLAVKSDWSLKTIYDVIATMKGSELPDQWVVRGNHHDGWVFGASDPLVGPGRVLDEAKRRWARWRRTAGSRKRSIVYASWDGEEPRLLGSTEWAETHADELKKKAVRLHQHRRQRRGFLGVERQPGSRAFRQRRSPSDVHRSGNRGVGRRRARAHACASRRCGAWRPQASAAEGRKPSWPPIRHKDLPIGALGSGSDYSAFLQHLGVAALDLGLAAKASPAASITRATTRSSITAASSIRASSMARCWRKTVGRLVMRAADADLPLQRPVDFADTVCAIPEGSEEAGRRRGARRRRRRPGCWPTRPLS